MPINDEESRKSAFRWHGSPKTSNADAVVACHMSAAICFDMYGTLFETGSVSQRCRDRIEAPVPVVEAIVDLWRHKQLAYSFQVALMDAYQSFWDLTAAALDYALAYYGVDLRATDRDAILASYEELDPFDDTVETLDRLAAEEYRLAILSNGTPEMLETLAENTGIKDRFESIISAHDVETFKPHPAVYEQVVDRFGVSFEDCWHVSANGWDAAGAAQAGLRVAWVNRSNEPPERVGGSADVTVSSLAGFASEVD